MSRSFHNSPKLLFFDSSSYRGWYSQEAEQLEREQELLRENVRRLRVQKLQLGNMLEEHEPTCHKVLTKESDKKSLDTEGDKEEEGKGKLNWQMDNNHTVRIFSGVQIMLRHFIIIIFCNSFEDKVLSGTPFASPRVYPVKFLSNAIF